MRKLLLLLVLTVPLLATTRCSCGPCSWCNPCHKPTVVPMTSSYDIDLSQPITPDRTRPSSPTQPRQHPLYFVTNTTWRFEADVHLNLPSTPPNVLVDVIVNPTVYTCTTDVNRDCIFHISEPRPVDDRLTLVIYRPDTREIDSIETGIVSPCN